MTTCKSCSKKNESDYDRLAGWHYQDGFGWFFGQVSEKQSIKDLRSAGIAYKAKHPEKAKAWDAWEKKMVSFAKAHKEEYKEYQKAEDTEILDQLNENTKALDSEFEKLDAINDN